MTTETAIWQERMERVIKYFGYDVIFVHQRIFQTSLGVFQAETLRDCFNSIDSVKEHISKVIKTGGHVWVYDILTKEEGPLEVIMHTETTEEFYSSK